MIPFSRQLSIALPPRADVLIFDANGGDLISRYILDGIPHAVLPARFEKIFIHPLVLARMIANLPRLRTDDMPRWWLVKPRMLFLQLRHLYFLACLDLVQPKVVLTCVDTHFFFQRCSRTFPGAVFIATVNGIRDRHAMGPPFLPPAPHPASRISMPHLYCNGKSDIDLYTSTGQRIDHFYPTGTLRGGIYLSRRSNLSPAATHDICFVSQWRRNMFGKEWQPELRRQYALVTLVEFVGRYIKEKPVRLCVACSSAGGADLDDEVVFYRTHLGDKVEIFPNQRADLSSYAHCDRAHVVISGWSSLGVEAFGWGKRVLLCNFKGDPKGELPVQGIFSLTKPDYALFKERLDAIRSMSDEEFRRHTGPAARYLMQFDPTRPAHVAIRKHVLACLGQQVTHPANPDVDSLVLAE